MILAVLLFFLQSTHAEINLFYLTAVDDVGVEVRYDLNPEWQYSVAGVDNYYTVYVPEYTTEVTWVFNNTNDQDFIWLFDANMNPNGDPSLSNPFDPSLSNAIWTWGRHETYTATVSPGSNYFGAYDEEEQQYEYWIEVLVAVLTTTSSVATSDPESEGNTEYSVIFNKTRTAFNTSYWEGASGNEVGMGQKLRQTFIGDDMDPPGQDYSEYLLVEFDTTAYGTWEAGDAITVEFGTDEVYRYEITGDLGAGQEDTHSFVIPLEPYVSTNGNAHTFTIGFTSTVNAGDEYYTVEPTLLETMTRADLALYCRPTNSTSQSVNHPTFVQEESGFIWNYANVTNEGWQNRLHLAALVPRYLYDFTIDFDDGNGLGGYNKNREFTEDVVSSSHTPWTSDMMTADTMVESTTPENLCGFETWYADIPWDYFNERGDGGVEQVETFNNGTHVTTDDDFYMYGSTIVFTGWEPMSQTKEGRTWDTVRYSTWRVPMIVRFQRVVYVETDTEVHLCPADIPPLYRDPYCTLTHVAALVQHVQANTVYDLETQDYRADVSLDITTKVFYPYMFISGEQTDDPPTYWETYNQTQYYPAPLDGDSWFPPTVTYVPATFVAGTQVDMDFTFVSEDTAGCSFINHNDIQLNLGRECVQNWNLYIQPLNGACYIDGIYTVTWAARCFYDKPTCSFNDDDNGNRLNIATVDFQVHSTNMCPEIVHEVDIFGVLCPTGRYSYYLCDEAEAANIDHINEFGVAVEDVNTFFQNDDIYIFLEAYSNDAKIVYTRILEIWADQDFSSYNLGATPTDMNWHGMNMLWSHENEPNNLTYTSSITGLSEDVASVVTSVVDSNHFASTGFTDVLGGDLSQGTGATDNGNFAGFEINYDSRIFAVPADSWSDVTFQVQVEIWYEGWGDNKPRRRLDGEEKEDSERDSYISGRDIMWLSTSTGLYPEKTTYLPCFADLPETYWTFEVHFTDAQVQKYGSKLEKLLEEEMQKALQSTDASLHGVTWLDDRTAIVTYFVSDPSLWEPMKTVFESAELATRSEFWYSLKRTDVYCLDAPQDTSLEDLTDCATGLPCSFLGGQELKDYTGPDMEDDSGVSTLAWTLPLVMVFVLW